MMRVALATSAAMVAVLALPALAQDQRTPVLPDGTLLEIAAEGSSTRVPDVAVIEAGVTTQAVTASEAMTQNGQRMSRVLAALKRAGIADRDVQTSRLNLGPQYRYEQNQPPILTGYQAVNQVTVRFRDIAKTGTILDTLVREGANDIQGPNLTLDAPEAAMDEARADAVAKARARAELYAKAAGLRVGRIVSISEGAASPPPMPMYRMRAEAASADTSVVSGETKVAVALNVRFLLK